MATSIDRYCPHCRRTTEFLNMEPSGVPEYCRGCGNYSRDLFPPSKPRRFNLRVLFVWFTALSLLIGVLHRPLTELLKACAGINSGHWRAFANPFRIFPWLFNAEWEYYEGARVEFYGTYLTEGETLFEALGCLLTLVVIVVIAVSLIAAFVVSLERASRSK